MHNNFIFKEIAFYEITPLFPNIIYNYFIKFSNNLISNLRHKYSNKWLVKKYHLIPFEYGFYNFSLIKKHFLNQNNFIFFVKGTRKLNILKQHTNNNIYDLELDLGCTESIKNLENPKFIILNCQFEKHNCNSHFIHCSVKKLNKLAYWWYKHVV